MPTREEIKRIYNAIPEDYRDAYTEDDFAYVLIIAIREWEKIRGREK